ncbi:hypothetical protein ACRAWG_06700 [Methylobacterium sp. P31]
MPLDPFALIIAAVFTAGCVSIQALRHRAEHVTLVLAALAYGLVVAVASLLMARNGLSALPDSPGTWMVVSVAGVRRRARRLRNCP